jgi:hypothetical protein
MSTTSSPEAAAVVHARKDMIAALATYNRAWAEMYHKCMDECTKLQAENAALKAHLASVHFLVSHHLALLTMTNPCRHDDDNEYSSAAPTR